MDRYKQLLSQYGRGIITKAEFLAKVVEESVEREDVCRSVTGEERDWHCSLMEGHVGPHKWVQVRQRTEEDVHNESRGYRLRD